MDQKEIVCETVVWINLIVYTIQWQEGGGRGRAFEKNRRFGFHKRAKIS
jgi:hypothetical protein